MVCGWNIIGLTLFTQLFTIIGLQQRSHINGRDTALPSVFAFLVGKRTEPECYRIIRSQKCSASKNHELF